MLCSQLYPSHQLPPKPTTVYSSEESILILILAISIPNTYLKLLLGRLQFLTRKRCVTRKSPLNNLNHVVHAFKSFILIKICFISFNFVKFWFIKWRQENEYSRLSSIRLIQNLKDAELLVIPDYQVIFSVIAKHTSVAPWSVLSADRYRYQRNS